jgi:hypothetical protein
MREVLLAIVLLFWVSGAHAECRYLSIPAECLAEAEQGNPIAQFVLGSMYENGEGVAQDHLLAAKWYDKAAEQGDVDAQYGLGKMYADGRGVAQNYVISHMWFSIAGQKGYQGAFAIRDSVAEKMTPPQIQKSQELAKAWMADHP